MSWLSIDCEDDTTSLVTEFDWPHSFVREAHLVSPSYVTVEDGGLVAADYLPNLKVLIVSQDKKYPGVEFEFDEVSEIWIWFSGDLNPRFSFSRDEVVAMFDSDPKRAIRAKRCRYQYLDECVWGEELRYGRVY